MTGLQQMTSKNALKAMWRICDKPERFRALDIIDRIKSLSEKVFWQTFWQVWTSHESIYLDHETIEQMISRHEIASAQLFLDQNERSAIEQLPDRFDIYRGCLNHNVMGYSWTLDRETAIKFANRSAGRGVPLVIHGLASKHNILALLKGRDEEEIVIRPSDVLIHYRESLSPLSKRAASYNLMYEKIHSGAMLSFPPYDTARLMVDQARRSSDDLSTLRAHMVKDLAISQELGSKRSLLSQAVIDIIDGK